MNTSWPSSNFPLAELWHSDVAVCLGIDNTPTESVVEALRNTALKLDTIRAALGHRPILINSGYRCPELNRAVRGSSTSAHMYGWAVDFRCPAYGTPKDIVRFLSKYPLEFDQLIEEGTWVHIAFAPGLRRQVLTAHFKPGGGVTYTEGVT